MELNAVIFNLFISFIASSANPPLNVLRKFAHLMDQSDLDFQEELEVTRLREEVVTNIRSSQQLEKDLNLMDIKIGLLVKNRITLQVSEHNVFTTIVIKIRFAFSLLFITCFYLPFSL